MTDIPFENLDEFLADVATAIDKPEAQPALKAWTEELAGDLGKGFLQSQSPLGEPWAPLKRKRPAGHNQGSRPLIDTGDLLQSVVSNAANNIEHITDDEVVYGSKDPKAVWHQNGTKKDGVPVIPARRFMDVSDGMADKAADLVANQLLANIGQL